jgi:type VI secretion system protein ImpJ
MNKADKVLWTEGMFLRPHHFQQAESYLLTTISQWGGLQQSYMWGFSTLEINNDLLAQGKLALLSASGIFPDGTLFDCQDHAQLPIPLSVTDNVSGMKVVLALPARRNGSDAVIFQESRDSLARFISYEQQVEDDNAMAVGSASVQFGRLRMRLMLESELTGEWTALGMVRIQEKRADNSLVLDTNYIPPLLHCLASRPLSGFISEVMGLLEQRSDQMGARLKQLGRASTSEVHDFLLLTLVNRNFGLLRHLASLPILHPQKLFQAWLPFATEMATYMPERLLPKILPEYQHNDLALTFNPLMRLLRQGLSVVTEENAIQLVLQERSHGLNVATITDNNMVHDFGFVLAVKANVSADMLMAHFPAQMKIAPVTRIRDLVQLQLPGIGLRAMPSAPPQLPWNAGYTYFELEKGGDLWQQMEKSSAFALHLAGEFPGLNMEFWAIRRQLA